MDKETHNKAKRAAKVLVREPALLDYVVSYYEDKFMDTCRYTAADDIGAREKAYAELSALQEFIASLRTLAEDTTEDTN